MTESQQDASIEDTPSGGATGLINEELVPVIGTFVAAAIVLVALLVDGSNVENWAYGIALATVAMFFALLRGGVALKGGSDEATSQAGKFLGHFLFAWCFIGTCILTFDGRIDPEMSEYIFCNMCFSTFSFSFQSLRAI